MKKFFLIFVRKMAGWADRGLDRARGLLLLFAAVYLAYLPAGTVAEVTPVNYRVTGGQPCLRPWYPPGKEHVCYQEMEPLDEAGKANPSGSPLAHVRATTAGAPGIANSVLHSCLYHAWQSKVARLFIANVLIAHGYAPPIPFSCSPVSL